MISPVWLGDHGWGGLSVCCCFKCLTCDIHMELVIMMGPSAGDSDAQRWAPFLHSLCKDTQRKEKPHTWRLFIVLMRQWDRLLPVLMQPNGYKVTAKIQLCLFFLSWSSFFKSQPWDKFLCKRYSWLPLGPIEARAATPLVFSSLANGTDTNMPVKNRDFFCMEKILKHFTLAAVIFQPVIIVLRTEQVHGMCIWIWWLFLIHCRTGRKGSLHAFSWCENLNKKCGRDGCILMCAHKKLCFFHVMSIKYMACCPSQINWLNNQAYTTLIW